jgi:hypothetical protein
VECGNDAAFLVLAIAQLAACAVLLVRATVRGDHRLLILTAYGAAAGTLLAAVWLNWPHGGTQLLLELVVFALIAPSLASAAGATALARTHLGALVLAAYTNCAILAGFIVAVFVPNGCGVKGQLLSCLPWLAAEILGLWGLIPFLVVGIPATLILWPILGRKRAFTIP